MRSPLAIAIAVILVLAGCSPRNHDSLSFQLSPGWKLQDEAPGGVHFYIVAANPPGEGSFMLSQWFQPTKPEEIPTVLRGIADGFVKQAKVSGINVTSPKYQVENFNGAEGQGSYAVFQTSYAGKNTLQTWFMVSIDGRVWNGEFLGSSNGWAQALTILKSVRKDRQQ